MGKTTLNIEEFLKKGTFVIPNYQRGYKWGVPDREGNDAVGILMDNLIEAYNNKQDEYFIQGVTVYEEGSRITLIDGQQRTTTFYLLLKYLGYNKLPDIDYTIREESKEVLNNCKIDTEKGVLLFKEQQIFDVDKKEYLLDEDKYNLQDIFYFTKAITTFFNKKDDLKEREDLPFQKFILEKVKLFYIPINKEDATKVFSMMNANKAFMKTDELIKAKLLSEVGKSKFKEQKKESELNNVDDIFNQFKQLMSEEWEKNNLRSRYAREWDKWLYWWNCKEIKDFWGSGNNPMGLLLEYYYYLKTKDNSYSQNEKDTHTTYKKFVKEIFNKNTNPKQIFLELRALQKKFEDWYNNYETYNYWGLILKTSNLKKEALIYFLDDKLEDKKNKIKEYAKWSLVGASHISIISPNELKKEDETKEYKAYEVYNYLKEREIYGNHNVIALKQLLRRNVLLDNKLERKFDFTLYGEKSLEHIYPKSWENEEDSKLNFEKIDEKYNDIKDNLSVHCIGNLVLIKKNENSKFSNKSFNEKKKIYFNTDNALWSLKLLHSISVFSKEKWEEEQIAENYNEFLNEFKAYYNIKDENNDKK